MNDLFTNTTVLLTEEFVKSCSREILQSKLTKLRLVTGIQFSKANKSYAVTGEWERVDAAFEVLTHWQENADHEPDFENVLNDRIAQLCDCDVINDFFKKYKLRASQSESESRLNDFHVNSNEAETILIEKTVEKLEKEYSALRDKLKFKRKDQKRSKQNNEKSTASHKTLKRKILIQHKKDVEKNSIFDSDSKGNRKSHQVVENGSSGHKIKATQNPASGKVPQTNSSDDDEHVNLVVPPSPNTSKDVISSKSVIKRNKHNGIVKLGTKNDGNVNKVTEKAGTKTQKKPGDKGYWSRAKRSDADQSHHCQECNVTLKSRKRYLEHMRRIHIREYQCNVCEKRFGYPTDLNRHKCPGTVVNEKNNRQAIRKASSKQNPMSESEQFHCLECNYVTPVKVRLSSHIQRTHRKELACDKCDKKFGFQKDLLKHQENIHSGSYYFCDQCSKLYKNKQIFDSHLKTHEPGYVKPIYNCGLCSKSLTTKYSLAVHMKTVHLGQKKVYLCQICGKKFSQRSSYKQHCNAHNGIKPYKCDICEKAFVYHKSLKEHKFMHDNIRRFTCVFCDKAFRQRTTLHIHLKTHKTVKDHICPVCGRGFAQKQAMERHERIHSGVRPYTCQLCNKSFGDTSTIRRHMISLHQKNETNWREDIQSSVKKKSDYYVFGGTGQNRVYKSNPSKKHSPSKKLSPAVSKPKTVQAQSSAVQASAELCQQEPSLILLNPVQNNVIQDPNCINVFNSVQGPPANGNSCNATQNYQTLQTLQPGTLYAIAASQTQQEQSQDQNGAVATFAPISNGFNQIIDFSTMTFVATKLPNQASIKHDNKDQIVQQSMQVGHRQNTNSNQNAAVVPLNPVSEGLTVGQSPLTTPVSSDLTLNQAIAGIWGLVGYPSYQSPGNVAHFQPPQNQ